MAEIGISITKRVAFRDQVQEFSNVYHYGSVDNAPNEGTAEGLIDELVTFEKSIHSTQVSFIHARLWSSGGTPQQNTMIFEKSLSGTGSSTPTSGLDKERAFLIQWDAGLDTLGRKVRLRKWFHTCGSFGTAYTPASGVIANDTAIPSASRTAIANKADECTRIGNLETWGLIAKSGRERDGGAPTSHKYFEHHQLGDQWRG